MASHRSGTVAVLLVALSACGGTSDEERLMDRMAGRCNAFVGEGLTLGEAGAEMTRVGFAGFQLECRGDLLSLPGDTCGPVSQEARVCQFYFYWRPQDPDACERGCCACQTRVTEADQLANGDRAVLCASRFERPFSCPF